MAAIWPPEPVSLATLPALKNPDVSPEAGCREERITFVSDVSTVWTSGPELKTQYIHHINWGVKRLPITLSIFYLFLILQDIKISCVLMNKQMTSYFKGRAVLILW